MSLRELWNVRLAFTARQRDAHDRDLILAWQIERVRIKAMQRDGGKKLPDLKALLQEGQREGPQTYEERRAVIHALSASLGVPLQKLAKGPDGRWIALN